MARFTFGASSGDLVTQAASSNSGIIKAAANYNAVGTFWSAQTGGTQYTDLVDPNNGFVAITGVSTDANGRPKQFQGPDGVYEGWLDFGSGRFKITASESGMFMGSLAIATTVTTAGALVTGKHNPVDATSGALIMTLPASPVVNGHLSVEKVDATANAVTVSGSIRGVTTTITLVLQHETLEFVADASGSWWPVAGHKTKSSLDALYQPVGPVATAKVTQGLYARTVPAPSGESSIVALCADPNNAGYLWAQGNTSAKIGYTTDNGATFNALVANPAAGQGICQAIITTNWFFILTTGTTSKVGQVWRSPAPNSTGSNVAFTKIFDLTGLVNGPGGAVASGPSNSSFRVGCMAVQPDESYMYLLTYAAGNDAYPLGGASDGIMSAGSDMMYSPGGGGGALQGQTVGATITVSGAGAAGATLTSTIVALYSNKKIRLADCAQTSVSGATFNIPSQTYGNQAVSGGPFIYVSSNIGGAAASITFTNTKFWSYAKHGHAVKIIGGVPWVALGDYPWPNSPDAAQAPSTHVGFHAATSAAGTSWTQKVTANAANPYDGINFFPITIGGAPMIIAESDSKYATGPIIVPTQTNTGSTVIPLAPMQIYMPHLQTMRSLYLTPEGNIMWYGTGESGNVGPYDGIWMAAAPFTKPFLLEQLTLNTVAAPNEAIAMGNYVWIGNNRITREKFLGQ